MKIVIPKNSDYERHTLLERIVRIIAVPLLNLLPSSFIQKAIHKSSKDAKTVLERVGSAYALEVMYTRHQRSLFEHGVLEGIANWFWYYCISQPKALRNRLKIVKQILIDELRRLESNSRSMINILTVGGGSARAIVESISSTNFKNKSCKIHVINIDRDVNAIKLGKELANKYGISNMFEWVNDDARTINLYVSPESIDIVEMVGLLDYFSEEKAIDVIKKIYNALRPGGIFIVANIHPNIEMVFVKKTGWPHMYYRQPEDLIKILQAAGFNSEQEIIIEPLKIHIIAEVRK